MKTSEMVQQDHTIAYVAKLYAFALRKAGKPVPRAVVAARSLKLKTGFKRPDYTAELVELLSNTLRFDRIFAGLSEFLEEVNDDLLDNTKDLIDLSLSGQLITWWAQNKLEARSVAASAEELDDLRARIRRLNPKDRASLNL